jgi:hypothetical protein
MPSEFEIAEVFRRKARGNFESAALHCALWKCFEAGSVRTWTVLPDEAGNILTLDIERTDGSHLLFDFR